MMEKPLPKELAHIRLDEDMRFYMAYAVDMRYTEILREILAEFGQVPRYKDSPCSFSGEIFPMWDAESVVEYAVKEFNRWV